MATGKAKRVVLIFMDWYLPGYKAGGPVRTCVNMVERLRNDFDFRIVTRNTDLNDNQPYSNIKSDCWVVAPDGTPAYYFSDKNLSLRNIKQIINETRPDVIHLNSMFSFYFTMAPLLALRNINFDCSVVLGPRGMLSRGALSIKPLKKKLFLQAAGLLGLFKNVTWHASTPVEKKEIHSVFGDRVRVLLAIDLAPELKIIPVPRSKSAGNANMFFLGRISEVKNLLLNIHILQKLDPTMNVEFHIYGPVEEVGYWERCKIEIDRLHPGITVEYKGPLDNARLKQTLKNYHFLFLLTKNENYGHAIVESLIEGCPVIISDRTPWRNLAERKAGWDLDLDNTNNIVEVVSYAIMMNQETYNQWSLKASEMADAIVNNPQSIRDNKNLFEDSTV